MYWASWAVCWINPEFGRCSLFPSWLISSPSYLQVTYHCLYSSSVKLQLFATYFLRRIVNSEQTTIWEPVTFCFLWRCGPTRAMASSFLRFLDHTQQRTIFGRTPLDEWSACRRDIYLATQNTNNILAFMPPLGFEPTISAGERPQVYAMARAATWTVLPTNYTNI